MTMNIRAGKAELYSQRRRTAQSLSGRMVDGLGQAGVRKLERKGGSEPAQSGRVVSEILVGQSVKDAPAPDSPNNLEAGVKIPKINGGEIRAAEPSFLENRLFIYPDKASDTTTTTTDEKVCVMRLVSMLLLLLLNYWLWYGGV